MTHRRRSTHHPDYLPDEAVAAIRKFVDSLRLRAHNYDLLAADAYEIEALNDARLHRRMAQLFRADADALLRKYEQ